MKLIVRQFDDEIDFVNETAKFISSAAIKCVRQSGRFALALSGGRTPAPVYDKLAMPPHRRAIPWTQVHLFWGDERFVPHEHSQSNFRMASEALVSRIPIPGRNVHPIRTDVASVELAAESYESLLKRVMQSAGRAGDRAGAGLTAPLFDLVLLGMGADGHTASLFPSSHALKEKKRWVVAVPPPEIEPWVQSITLSLPAINSSQSVLFLVKGAEKADLAEEVIAHAKDTSKRYPAALVRPLRRTAWFICKH